MDEGHLTGRVARMHESLEHVTKLDIDARGRAAILFTAILHAAILHRLGFVYEHVVSVARIERITS